MMSENRTSEVSKSFHFRVKMGKPFSHYWHYALYRVPATQTWYWVGDRNTLITTEETNQGGGGGGGDANAVKENLSVVTSQARILQIDTMMSKSVQDALTANLTAWDKSGVSKD